MRRYRRVRGWLLRLAFDRRVALGLGLVLLAPAVWRAAAGQAPESALLDGLVMILAATGAALVLAALMGRRPDWIEPDG